MFQAIILAIDFFDHVALQNGFLVEVEALGAVSFDLSGQIQISLWNKNAYSLVQKRYQPHLKKYWMPMCNLNIYMLL